MVEFRNDVGRRKQIKEIDMSASMVQESEDRAEELETLLTELYQILGQFQDEIPELVLDKIIAALHGDYNGLWYDEYPSLLPWVRGEQ